MNEKPEASEVAYEIETHVLFGSGSTINRTLLKKAVTTLRCLNAENELLREALGKSLTHEQILRIAATIDRSMPLESAKILFARRIEAALRREET